MARPKNPSKKFRRDPTNSQRKINRYERDLVKLFKNYQIRIVTDLKKMNARSLEAVNLNTKGAGDYLTQAEKEEIIDPAEKIVRKQIPEAYKSGVNFATIQLGGTKDERIDEWKKIAALIEKNLVSIKKLTDETGGKIRQTIADGVINEKTLWDIMKDIYDITDIGISRIRTITRTEIMIGVNTGIKDRYKSAGVEKGEWLAAIDDSTCDECEGLDGKKFPLDSFPDCPTHPNCRCSILPVIEIPEEEV